jgi:excisionase family DNA binding protein
MEQELDPDVEWITSRQAAAILGVSRERVAQLARRDLLPYVTAGRRRYFRRPQIEVVAHARDVRWHSSG